MKIPTILLADDDKDDILLFQEALEELPSPVQLITVTNGEQLIDFLRKAAHLPDVLFLDLNMPRKNGFECLAEIKQDSKLKLLPVIVISTSAEPAIVDLAYRKGAYYYVRKPNDYTELVKVLKNAITTITNAPSEGPGEKPFQPPIEEFILFPEPQLNEIKKGQTKKK